MRSFNSCEVAGGFLLAKIWLTGYLSKGKANFIKILIGIYPCFPFNWPSLKPNNSEALGLLI
jgi:hypothetical protein